MKNTLLLLLSLFFFSCSTLKKEIEYSKTDKVFVEKYDMFTDELLETSEINVSFTYDILDRKILITRIGKEYKKTIKAKILTTKEDHDSKSYLIVLSDKTVFSINFIKTGKCVIYSFYDVYIVITGNVYYNLN